jgi:hypothetical protein
MKRIGPFEARWPGRGYQRAAVCRSASRSCGIKLYRTSVRTSDAGRVSLYTESCHGKCPPGVSLSHALIPSSLSSLLTLYTPGTRSGTRLEKLGHDTSRHMSRGAPRHSAPSTPVRPPSIPHPELRSARSRALARPDLRLLRAPSSDACADAGTSHVHATQTEFDDMGKHQGTCQGLPP